MPGGGLGVQKSLYIYIYGYAYHIYVFMVQTSELTRPPLLLPQHFEETTAVG